MEKSNEKMNCSIGNILLKFIEKDEYAENFLNGHLYMNTLHYYWNEYKINKKISEDAEDILEGSVATAYIDSLRQDFGDRAMRETFLRAVGYQYCNVLCFYKMELKEEYGIIYELPNMNAFGSNVVIIKNIDIFLQRINSAMMKNGYKFLCKDVTYKDPESLKNIENRPTIMVKRDQYIDFRNEKIITSRDCFNKTSRYSSQKEWRVAMFRGEKKTEAYTLYIKEGLRDIACVAKSEDLTSELDKLLLKRDISIKSINGSYGNINRRDLRELFYELGDYKAEILATVW